MKGSSSLLRRSFSGLGAALLVVVGPFLQAAELASVPVYSVAEVSFVGPFQIPKDTPARDVQLAVTFRHESGAAEFTVQGFFDGDGQGGIEGNVFKARFCPTQPGRWILARVESNVNQLTGQHQGDTVVATASELPGFWIPDDTSAGGRWYRRSDGSHPFIFGNTHYTFLTEHGTGGKPTGGSIAADMAGNAKFFKKVRFGLQNGRYPHPTEKPWLDDAGQPTDDGNYSFRPNPGWFHQRVDLAVDSAFESDLIADLILCGPDTVESRSTLQAGRNGGDAVPYLRYIAARYGSYPNVWLCLANEYDIKQPKYTQAYIAELGVALRAFLPYPTPLSVHDGSRIGWSPKFDTLPEWADHQIIQKKVRRIATAADAIAFVWRGEDGRGPRRRPTINDELSYEGKGDKHTQVDTIAAHLGAFLGGGYGTSGEKYGNKLGQYFWGRFDAAQHTAADKLSWLREMIDRDITFWQLAPGASDEVFPNLDPRFRAMVWEDREYVLGTDQAKEGLVADLPDGSWTVTRHDVMAKQSTVLSTDAFGRFRFDAPASRAVLFHFKCNDITWPLHVIDDSSQGADGVRLADVNGDRLVDIATGWEEGGIARAYLNPGAIHAREPWPAVTVGRTPSVEDAVWVDLDADGAVDMVTCCEGDTRTMFVHWAPVSREQLLLPSAWRQESIPATRDRMQWMFAQPMDLDGRSGIDLVAGGKGLDAQLGWLESPSDSRALADWKWHAISDAGWIMSIRLSDMDQDGDGDILITDRRGIARGCRWLENPGRGDALSQPWSSHPIGGQGREVMFATLADLDRDGWEDVLLATKPAEVRYLRRLDGSGLRWAESTVAFPKGVGTAKGVAAADVDLDGQLDLVISCEDAIPPKSGVRWLSYRESPFEKEWQDHEIAGSTGIKFDRIELLDLDADGDLDVLTCEERHAGKGLGVIWYENPAR